MKPIFRKIEIKAHKENDWPIIKEHEEKIIDIVKSITEFENCTIQRQHGKALKDIKGRALKHRIKAIENQRGIAKEEISFLFEN